MNGFQGNLSLSQGKRRLEVTGWQVCYNEIKQISKIILCIIITKHGVELVFLWHIAL